jgi:hypothetical protein
MVIGLAIDRQVGKVPDDQKPRGGVNVAVGTVDRWENSLG